MFASYLDLIIKIFVVIKAKRINPDELKRDDILYMVNIDGSITTLKFKSYKYTDLYCFDITDTVEKTIHNIRLVVYTLADLFLTKQDAIDFIETKRKNKQL